MSEEELISLIEKTLGEMDSIANEHDSISASQAKKRCELAKTFSLLGALSMIAKKPAYKYIKPKKSIRGENSVSASEVEINKVTNGA